MSWKLVKVIEANIVYSVGLALGLYGQMPQIGFAGELLILDLHKY